MANKSIFLDVDSNIIDKNLRFAQNAEEEEFNKLFEAPQQEVYPSKLVKPFPGFCIKTREVGSETKFFVNICHTEGIPPPKDISEKELYEILSSDEAPDFRVPMSIGDIREEKDNSGNLAKCCDVAIHPDFFKKIENITLFKNFFLTVVFEGLKDKHGIICTDDKIVLKNKKAFGTLQMHRIQQREIAEKMGLNYENIKKNENKPKIEVIESKINEIKTRLPEYRLFRRKQEPNCLYGEFKFPDIFSAKELTVDVGEDRILIEANSKHYLLDVFVPFIIRQSSCSSTFNKATKTLTLTMPIVGG